jgi:hypothetical protein
MRHTARYDLNTGDLIPPRKRLLDMHNKLGSWHKVSKALRVNVASVYNFAIYGRLSGSPRTRRRLLGKKTINEHLAEDRIADMPSDLLAWALLNRKEF